MSSSNNNSGGGNGEIADAIKDFVFDLHDSTRRSYRVDDVQQLYDSKFKEISEKYLSHSVWPNEEAIASECDDDEIFLLFYRELTLRHFFAKQKHIQIAPYLESWKTYNKLFDLLITSPNSFIAITPQWAYDIIQEFVYQFQSFSQYRSQHRDSSGEDGRLLEENQTAWSLPAVTFLLSRAVGLTTTYAPSGSIHYLIGYFSIIELSRVECLVCDYSASYETVSALIQPATSGASSGTPALYTTVFQSYLNLFYHTGISLIMLHRYSEAIELYSTIALHMARLQKPGGTGGNNANSKSSPYNQYQKIGDKILSLTALAAALSPSTPLDDHVADLMANKLGDKFRRLKTGNDVNVYREIFDSSVPKFVSSSTSVTSNDLRHAQTELFLTEVKQELDLITTRNYLRLYTTIPISKLANFTNSTEEQTLLRLQALANKCQQEQQSAADGASVLKFSIQGTEVIVENGGKKKGITAQGVERYFTNGIRKNAELSAETEKIFRKLDA